MALKGKSDFGKSPHLFELIDKHGRAWGANGRTFKTAAAAADMAAFLWPDQEQDPDRTGAGYDIEVIGGGQ